MREFNEIVHGRLIYEEHRFAESTRRQQTKDLILRAPKGAEVARRNRLLLEEAYSKELAGKPESA